MSRITTKQERETMVVNRENRDEITKTFLGCRRRPRGTPPVVLHRTVSTPHTCLGQGITPHDAVLSALFTPPTPSPLLTV